MIAKKRAMCYCTVTLILRRETTSFFLQEFFWLNLHLIIINWPGGREVWGGGWGWVAGGGARETLKCSSPRRWWNSILGSLQPPPTGRFLSHVGSTTGWCTAINWHKHPESQKSGQWGENLLECGHTKQAPGRYQTWKVLNSKQSIPNHNSGSIKG